jgi:hypothetical protein
LVDKAQLAHQVPLFQYMQDDLLALVDSFSDQRQTPLGHDIEAARRLSFPAEKLLVLEAAFVGGMCREDAGAISADILSPNGAS